MNWMLLIIFGMLCFYLGCCVTALVVIYARKSARKKFGLHQRNWNQTDRDADDYIRSKPKVPENDCQSEGEGQ